MAAVEKASQSKPKLYEAFFWIEPKLSVNSKKSEAEKVRMNTNHNNFQTNCNDK